MKVELPLPRFHRYIWWLNSPIYYDNEGWYLLWVLTSFLIPVFFILHMTGPPQNFLNGLYSFLHFAPIPHKILIVAVLYLAILRLWELGTFIYAISTGLTLHELFCPQHYRYLFRESSAISGKYRFLNPNNFGLLTNWARFVKQMCSKQWLEANSVV